MSYVCRLYNGSGQMSQDFYSPPSLPPLLPPPLPSPLPCPLLSPTLSLPFINQVTCSVQGLDSKLLKSYLKKESCYTSMMASARIRGVERVVLVTDHIHYERKTYRVTDDMTFGHLMDDACHIDQSTRTLLNNWYLLDESKGSGLLYKTFFLK